jgi:hypothetical protein
MATLKASVSYHYNINLDERGESCADVPNTTERSVFEIKGFEIFEDGRMRHKSDLEGLKRYGVRLELKKPDEPLVPGNCTRGVS